MARRNRSGQSIPICFWCGGNADIRRAIPRAKGWESLSRQIGVEPEQLLEASNANLANALRPGGMVAEIRVVRLKEIAARVKDEFGGDLGAALVGPIAQVRKALKNFPGIGDPGADRILLFGSIVPVAAIPSNCPHVAVRLQSGQEGANYVATYREAQRAVEAQVPKKFDARARAYLLLKRHGQDICKRTKPKCTKCPVSSFCAYFAGNRRKVSRAE